MPFLAAVAFWGMTWAAVISYAIAIAGAIESSRKARSMKRAAIRDYNASLEDRLVMIATANGARSRCYGRVRNVDGVIFKGTWGAKSENYTLVVALAGHEIDGIETVYFNDVPVTLQADGVPLSDGRVGYWVVTPPILQSPILSATAQIVVSGGVGSLTLPFTPIAGSMSASAAVGFDSYEQAVPTAVGNVMTITTAAADATWTATYQYVGFYPRARVWKYLGAPGQNMSLLLAGRFPSIIGASDKFSGIAALVVELQYDTDAWPTGVPSINAVIRGAKVYDPRNATTAWSENPALIARDWALYANGGACASAEIVEPAFIAAANACDISTNFSTAAGTETRPLYQCGIVCRLDTSPDDSFDEIIESMAGKWGWAAGRLTVAAGVYRAPVASITDAWVTDAEDIVVIKDTPRADVVNVYRPTIADAGGYINGGPGEATATTYTVTPMPEVRSAAFIADDGQELPREVTFGGVNRSVHAQHICGVMMRDSRDGLVLRLPCNMRAWVLELFDVITVTLPFFGFAAKPFEVLGWKYAIDSGVILTLKETHASIYDPTSGLSVLNAAVNSTLPLPWLVGSLTGLTVVSGTVELSDGTSQTRTLITWNETQDESVGQSGKIEVQYIQQLSPTLPEDWPSWIEEGGSTSATIPGLLAGQPYLFRIRAINTLGVRGAWCLQVRHIVTPPPPLIKIWYQAAAPTIGVDDDDLWIDTDAGNALYMRVAGNWVSVVDAGIAAATAAAFNAQTTANAANANATAALSALTDIASDSLLTPGEKPALILSYDIVTAEQAGIDAKATVLGITTEKATYDSAVAALSTYMATLTSPVLWSNLSGNTTIVGVTFRSKFAVVYAARQALLNLIATTIATGSVTTGHLALASATTTAVARNSFAAAEVTAPAPDVTATSASLAFANDTTGTVSVQVEVSFANVYCYAWSTMTIHSVFLDQTGATEGAAAEVVASLNANMGEMPEGSAKLFQYTLASGATLVAALKMRCASATPGAAINMDLAVLRLTAIKR